MHHYGTRAKTAAVTAAKDKKKKKEEEEKSDQDQDEQCYSFSNGVWNNKTLKFTPHAEGTVSDDAMLEATAADTAAKVCADTFPLLLPQPQPAIFINSQFSSKSIHPPVATTVALDQPNFKGVEVPTSVPEGTRRAFAEFLGRLTHCDKIIPSAATSFTRILVASPYDLDTFTRFLDDEISRIVGCEDGIEVLQATSWTCLAAKMPPAMMPHVYLMCELLRRISIVLRRRETPFINVNAILHAASKLLCDAALDLEFSLEKGPTWRHISRALAAIMNVIKFPADDEDHAVKVLGKHARRGFLNSETRKGDLVLGIAYLYGVFMSACGRYPRGYNPAIFFDDETKVFQLVTDYFGMRPVPQREHANMLLVTDEYVKKAGQGLWDGLPMSCLVIVVNGGGKDTVSFGFGAVEYEIMP